MSNRIWLISSVGKQERVFLIHSDMVHHRQIVQGNISSIKNCTINQDCDLVQCEGICAKNNSSGVQCEMDADEDNLGRICRMLLFVSSTPSGLYFGLLGSLPSVDARSLNRIKELHSHPFKRSSNAWPRRKETIDKIKEIVLQLDRLIYILEK